MKRITLCSQIWRLERDKWALCAHVKVDESMRIALFWEARYFGITMTYRVVLIESEEGFAVGCPALPGCWTQGATRDEALVNIRQAIRDWLEIQEQDLRRDLEIEGTQFTQELVTV